MKALRLHHAAVLCSDYARSREFYVHTLNLRVVAEHYRQERDSYKLDLALGDGTQIELFSFPSPPKRPTRPEACGLRHLAFAVDDLTFWRDRLIQQAVEVEDIRVDPYTGCRFFFLRDPDDLPLEMYEPAAMQ
jgi:glyoxylase I family protein